MLTPVPFVLITTASTNTLHLDPAQITYIVIGAIFAGIGTIISWLLARQIAGVDSSLDKLHGKTDTLRSEVGSLEKDLALSKQDRENLRGHLLKLQGSIEGIGRDMGLIQNSIEDLEIETKMNGKLVGHLEKQVGTMQTEVGELKHKVSQMDKELYALNHHHGMLNKTTEAK